MDNRPKGREKHVTNGGTGVHKRGDGLGTGPVGSGKTPGGLGGNSGGPKRAGGGSPLSIIVVILALIFGGGKFALGGLGGSGGGLSQAPASSGSGTGYYTNASSTSGWTDGSNTGDLDETVVDGARAKRTMIKGNGKDIVTMMIYMCGTDLESRSGMATSDLQEMASATVGNNVNIIVYTGGCNQWKNNIVSSRVNQIYQIKEGGVSCLVKDAGNGSMTDPKTLASFIQWCSKNYPANRNELILWDHGGGSVSGYGYDEKNARAGSMNLSGINAALNKAGVTFDFIGFDACLMATVENALMLDKYADYLIASEETEPGVGWYYTPWVTALAKNPSMPTIEIGKNIVDSFVDECARKCRGQATTLSIVDLAELSATVPDKLKSFASSTCDLIQNNQFKQVSDARYGSREFAQSTKIDQIDLTHFAKNLKTKEGSALAKAITSAVKYNRTSTNMTNAYGLSIYFPYRKTSTVDTAVKTYAAIGMDDEYARCIQSFAKMEVSGQSVSGGTSNPFSTISSYGGNGGSISGSSSQSQQSVSLDSQAMMQILQALMGGNITGSGSSQSFFGLNNSNIGFLTGKSIPDDVVTDYVTTTQLSPEDVIWTQEKGKNILKLREDQWSMVHDLALNMFYDDGEGYVDLGLDNVFDFDSNGNLIGETDRTWVSINEQPVAYYYERTIEDGDEYAIYGHVPALLNGERVNLQIIFDSENPNGYIAGAVTDYKNQETDTVAKSMIDLEKGDTLDFLCDYYNYDGTYSDTYYLGEQITVEDGDMMISNTKVGDGDVICSYCFTDIYNQTYWTPAFN